jgi:subfamily B ATP-binding cassette protein MsbA
MTIGIIMLYGGQLVYNKEMAAASFITYIALVSQIIRPAKALSQSFGNIFKGVASAERIFEVVDAKSSIKEIVNPIKIKGFNKNIEIKNLSFKYLEDFVLQDINLTFEKGKMYGIVGASGSGKSTLAELLLRFYPLEHGNIFLDGADIYSIVDEDFRKLVSVVTQEAILFNDTIYNNITFGLNNLSREKVIEAAKAAHAHEFIVDMENGYDSQIGDRGTLLSGGQRQRISIARAILRNPEILILDEATSALDTTSEKIVQEAINTLMQNRTSIVIAHRLSTIKMADDIIVFEKGKIIERGTHNVLVEKSGLYARLWERQG